MKKPKGGVGYLTREEWQLFDDFLEYGYITDVVSELKKAKSKPVHRNVISAIKRGSRYNKGVVSILKKLANKNKKEFEERQ